jgi:hypothetical protein
MKTIVVSKNEGLNLSEYIKRSALDTDCSHFINTSTRVVDENGKTIMLYFVFEDTKDTEKLRWAVQNISYEKSERTGGLKTQSAIFGYSPRNTIRKDFCSATSMAMKHPKQHSIICEFAKTLSGLYETHIPEVFQSHLEVTEVKVKKDWKLKETPFTSGIVNKNNPLKYHFDSGNFKGVYSNMIVFKNKVEGGYLACPEYDLMFECADNSVMMFDGQDILHGVTPIQNLNRLESYRYSLVYYSLQQMWNCTTVTEELVRFRQKRLEREEKRAKI